MLLNTNPVEGCPYPINTMIEITDPFTSERIIGMVVDQSCFDIQLAVPYGYIDSEKDQYPIVYPIYPSMNPVHLGDATQWAGELLDDFPCYQQFNDLQLALFDMEDLGTLSINRALYFAAKNKNFDIEFAKRAIQDQDSMILMSRIKGGSIIENAGKAGPL